MSGTVLIGLVLCIAAVALVLAATAIDVKKPKINGLVKKEIKPSCDQKASTNISQKNRVGEEDEEALRVSTLIIPPPTENRIEAVAPRNDQAPPRRNLR